MLLIKNGYIKTMTGKDYECGEILIDHGKIVDVGETVPNDSDCEVLDVNGALVMPGIIEAHSHIGIIEEKKGKEGDDCNEATNPITPYLRAIDAINPMDPAFHNAIAAGITSVMVGPGSSNVVGGQFAFIKMHGRVIDDMVVKEPAAMKVALGENPKVNFGDQNQMPATRMATAALLREELTKARQYLMRKDSDEIEFRLEPWRKVFSKEIPLKMHAHRADDIMTAIRIAKEFDLRITIDHCSEGHFIADEIYRSGFPAIVGPDLTTRNKIECQYMGFKTAGVLQKQGVMVALTTDHPVSLIQSLPICAGFAAKAGLGVENAYRAITIDAARICGVDTRLGSLEPGKDADIAIFTGNPMEVFTQTLYTIIDGEIVYDLNKDDQVD